ncbi:MAG: DUF5723 family protein [Crocinitomicaceae bacterium]
MKHFLPLLFLLVLAPIQAQSILSTYTTYGSGLTTSLKSSDAFNKNLSQMSFDTTLIGFSVFGVHSNISTEGMLKKDLVSFLINQELPVTDGNIGYVKNILTEPIFFDFGINYVNANVRLPKNFRIGFSVDEHLTWKSSISLNLVDFLLNSHLFSNFESINVIRNSDTLKIDDYNDVLDSDTLLNGKLIYSNSISELFKNSVFDYARNRYYSLGFSKLFNLKNNQQLSIGFTFKYVQSLGQLSFNSQRSFQGRVISMGRFNPEERSDIDKIAGHGIGFDLGISYKNDKFQVGLALNNLGIVQYQNNYEIIDSILVEYNLDPADIIQGKPDFVVDRLYDLYDRMEYKSKMNQPLAGNMLLNFSYQVFPKLKLGGDLFVPLFNVANSFGSPMINLGVEYEPWKWFQIGLGNSISKYFGYNLSLGFKFNYWGGRMQSSISTMDITTFFKQKSPTLSINVCLLKFRF